MGCADDSPGWVYRNRALDTPCGFVSSPQPARCKRTTHGLLNLRAKELESRRLHNGRRLCGTAVCDAVTYASTAAGRIAGPQLGIEACSYAGHNDMI